MPEDSPGGTDNRPDSALPAAAAKPTVTPAVAAALVILAVSFLLSVAFVLANGGLDLPAAASVPASSIEPVASRATPSGTAPVTGNAGPIAPARPVSARPVARATSATQVAAPIATTDPTTSPAPLPSSTRFALLTSCPDTPDCWVYIVRRGDNLVSIANYFGVTLREISERNPWTTAGRLLAGQKLLLPTPRR